MSIYKRFFAWMYHIFLSDNGQPDIDDPFMGDVRLPLLAQASGSVLEIGAGDGANLPHYPSGTHVTALEPNPHMIDYLKKNMARLSLIIDTIIAPAEKIPFPDDHFDTVVSIHVLCSVNNPDQVLAEVKRVLRPGGRFLFLEHVTAEAQTPTYHVQRLINPAWRLVGDGCNLTRDTGEAIRSAGFRTVEVNAYDAGFPKFVSPHVYGWAQV